MFKPIVKRAKVEKETSQRFHWIRLNLKWYDNHGQMSPSGYYEERRACGDANCGTRILPLGTPQTPKPSLSHIGHYEQLRVVDNLMEDPLSEEKLKELNLFPKIEVSNEKYKQMDYFLTSKGLDTVYSHRRGLNDCNEINFRKLFPCPWNSLREWIRKHME